MNNAKLFVPAQDGPSLGDPGVQSCFRLCLAVELQISLPLQSMVDPYVKLPFLLIHSSFGPQTSLPSPSQLTDPHFLSQNLYLTLPLEGTEERTITIHPGWRLAVCGERLMSGAYKGALGVLVDLREPQ